MARDPRVKVRIEAEDNTGQAVTSAKTGFNGLSTSLKVGFVAAAALAFTAVKKLVGALGDAITAATVQEDAIKKLDTALKSLGPTSVTVSKNLQAQASALQKVTTAGDETIIKGQALLASFTKSESQIKAATVAALDLAAATGVDLNAAFLLMGKAAAGETSTLSRYGIILDEGLTKSEKFAAAIEKIGEQFGGQASAQAETFSGRISQIGNAYGDLTEKVGAAFTENEKITESLTRVRDILTSGGLVEGVEDLAEAMADATTASVNFIEGLSTIGEKLNTLNAAAQENVPVFEELGGGFGLVSEVVLRLTGAKGLLTLVDLINGVGSESAKTAAQVAALTQFLTIEATVTEQLAVSEERLLRIRRETTEQLSTLTDISKRLGVTLESSVNESLKKNAEALIEAEKAARAGVITYQDLANIEDAVAESNNQLTESLTGTGTAAIEAGEGVEVLTQGLAELDSRQRTTQSGLASTARAFNQAAVAAAQFNAVTGGAPQVARDHRDQGTVDATVAAGGKVTQGGTRIRLPGGGSRLLGQRDFTGLNN